MTALRSTFGQWNQAINILQFMNKRMDDNMETVTRQNAITLRDETKNTIAETDPDWPELMPQTIQRKGSSKPLVDHGDLLASIKDTNINKHEAFVGVNKGVENKDGTEIVDIARVQEFGDDNLGIPARSFIYSTFLRIREFLASRYIESCKATLRGLKYRV